MLDHIKIENFRCFRSVDTELSPLTVLIGANNTGKSAFLDAIRVLGEGDRQLHPLDAWRRIQDTEVRITAHHQTGPNHVVSMTVSRGECSRERGGPVLSGVEMFRLPSYGLKCHDQGFSEPIDKLPLGESGEHTASVLDYLLRKDRKRFDGIVATLRDLVPGFMDLAIDTPNAKLRHLSSILDDGLELPGESLSVGLRHLIFFVTLAYHPRAPDVILIEEPELGVHPKRLGDIMRLLRSISQGDFCDHAAQVILSTHSPFLLDHVDLDHDQLLIFQREESDEGARTVTPADKDRLRTFLDEFMLGEVWFNETEKGLISQ